MRDFHLIEIAVAPKSKVDRVELVSALRRLASADPSLCVAVDDESGQIMLKGMSEIHLDTTAHALRRISDIAVEFGPPQVAYRETLTKRVEKDYTHRPLKDGIRQFARLKIIFEPSATGGFESHVSFGAIPDHFISGIETGVNKAFSSGLLAGFPVIDVKATLVDGAFHEKESSALAFETAARSASREALREGGPRLLEPIAKVEVTSPKAYTGFVMGDLLARRGQVQRQDVRGDLIIVHATVPFANTFGYGNQLRAGTQGHGTYAIQFSHYAPALPYPDDDGPIAPAMALRG